MTETESVCASSCASPCYTLATRGPVGAVMKIRPKCFANYSDDYAVCPKDGSAPRRYASANGAGSGTTSARGQDAYASGACTPGACQPTAISNPRRLNEDYTIV